MEEKENIQKVVAANLRSVTQSCKGGVPIERLERDYRDLLGTPIPYRSMGYSSLEAMIRSMPDVIKMARSNGQTVVVGVADETTAHIASLVSRQKDAKSKKFVSKNRRPYRMQIPVHAQFRPAPQYVKRFNVRSAAKPPPYVPPQERTPPAQKKNKVVISENSYPAPRQDYPAKSSFEIPPRFLKKLQVTTGPAQKTPDSPDRVVVDAELQPWVPIRPPSAAEAPLSPPVFSAAGDSFSERKISSPIAKRQPKLKRTVELPSSIPALPYQLPGKEFVIEYARLHNLEPRYQTRTIGQKRKMYISTLTLGEKKYHSFPDEKPTIHEAEELAASRAKEDIQKKALESKFAETKVDTIEDINILMGRIEEIVASKPNGIWNIGVPKEYETKYSESLPASWLFLVQQNLANFIEFEVPDRLNLPKDACILRIMRTPSGTNTPTSTSSRHSNPFDEESATDFCHQTSNLCLQGVPPLILPEHDQWPVVVTAVSSTVNISVCLIEYVEESLKCNEQIVAYYKTHCLPVQRVVKNKLYATYLSDSENTYWHRVCVQEILPETNEVTCYLGDLGTVQNVNISCLQELDPRFETLPFQAICLKLSGLEDYVDVVKPETLVTFLLDKTFIAKIMSRNENEIIATIYDTSGEDDVNMNDLLLEATIRESLSSDLPEVGSTSMFYLTHVTLEGDIYVRSCASFLGLLESELEKLTSVFEHVATNEVLKLSAEKMYVSQYTDGVWYRTLLTGTSDLTPDMIEVFYVDFGNTSWVPLTSTCELEPISSFLASLPYQAIPCTLNDVPLSPSSLWTEAAVTKLYELAGDNEELILKVDHPATNTTSAKVSLFKRNEDSVIISINQTLAFTTDLFRVDESAALGKVVNAPAASAILSPAVKPASLPLPTDKGLHSSILAGCIPDVAVPAAEVEVKIARQKNEYNVSQSLIWTPTPEAGSELLSDQNNVPLPPPVIPKITEMFDVYVTLVASPSNFVVQPISSSKDLTNLMEEMQKFYSHDDNICDMHLCLLKEDNFYAVLHTDGIWYRACLKNVLHDDPVTATVYFVDYGDFGNVEMSKLQPLWKTFKTLPCQAIKASLASVKPRFDDWDVEECIAFKALAESKSFVSVVLKNNSNEASEPDKYLLELHLIDTSLPDKDIFLHMKLVEDNLALLA